MNQKGQAIFCYPHCCCWGFFQLNWICMDSAERHIHLGRAITAAAAPQDGSLRMSREGRNVFSVEQQHLWVLRTSQLLFFTVPFFTSRNFVCLLPFKKKTLAVNSLEDWTGSFQEATCCEAAQSQIIIVFRSEPTMTSQTFTRRLRGCSARRLQELGFRSQRT